MAEGALVSAGAGATALVTGGAGFLGSHLVESLVAADWRVRVLDDLSTGREENLRSVREHVAFERGDVRQPAVVERAARGAEVIFHLAARTGARESFEDPATHHATNAEGTLWTLEAARTAGARRLVFASSWLVYGPVDEDRSGWPLVETRPPAPASPYAAQKLSGEQYCAIYHRLHALETVALRYFALSGPRQRADGGYGAAPHGGAAQTECVPVSEAVRATLQAAHAPAVAGRVVHVPGAGSRLADPSRARELLGLESGADEGADASRDRPATDRAARSLGARSLGRGRDG
jgi:UDP-glucose 4-epimerase